jgi:hypothetical protein
VFDIFQITAYETVMTNSSGCKDNAVLWYDNPANATWISKVKIFFWITIGPESADEREKYPFSYHRLSLNALATCYKRMSDIDREADILEELRRHYPDSSKVREETQAIEDNSSNIGIREKRDNLP